MNRKLVRVTLRQKDISKGRKSLYLDFYPPIRDPKTGKETRREFLNQYIYTDKVALKRDIAERERKGNDTSALKALAKALTPLSPIEKLHNAETLKIAEAIRQRKENELNKPEIYNKYEQEQIRLNALGEQDFVAYLKKLRDKRYGSNYNIWSVAITYFEQYVGGQIKFADLSQTILEEYKDHLVDCKSIHQKKGTIKRNTAQSYFNKIKAGLKQAFKDGILQQDLNAKISQLTGEETRREFLTLQELNQLVRASCENELLKRAALFSALTGLRFSDIHKLVWAEVEHSKEQGYYLNFRQQKTNGVEVLPISDQAYTLLGQAKDADAVVFDGLVYSAYENQKLTRWVENAGITKKITFHCFRHTFATLQLSCGTDIYTVSKLLGHRNLQTTQVYAKIVDKTKRRAANSIRLNL